MGGDPITPLLARWVFQRVSVIEFPQFAIGERPARLRETTSPLRTGPRHRCRRTNREIGVPPGALRAVRSSSRANRIGLCHSVLGSADDQNIRWETQAAVRRVGAKSVERLTPDLG